MDDDDAFLYGDDAPASELQPFSAAQLSSAPSQQPDQSSVTPSAQGASGDQDDDGSSSMDESELDSSDDDLEIVMDAPETAAAKNASTRSGMLPSNDMPIQPHLLRAHIPGVPASQGSTPVPGAPSPTRKSETPGLTSDYTPLPRSSAATAGVHIPQAAPDDGLVHTLPEGAEGPPPHAPATAPTLNLSPSLADLQVPDSELGGRGKLGSTNLYHLDPTRMASKPWRRPGADLTDWFNYGFDESSWARWGAHQRQILAEKGDAEAKVLSEGMYNTFDPTTGMLPGMNPDAIIATMPSTLQNQVNNQLGAMQAQMVQAQQAQLGMMYTQQPHQQPPQPQQQRPPHQQPFVPHPQPHLPPQTMPPHPGQVPGTGVGNNGAPPGPEVSPAIHMGRGSPGAMGSPPLGDETNPTPLPMVGGGGGSRFDRESATTAGGPRLTGRDPRSRANAQLNAAANRTSHPRVSRRAKTRHELDHFEGESGTGLDYSYSYEDDQPAFSKRDSSSSKPSSNNNNNNNNKGHPDCEGREEGHEDQERSRRRSASPDSNAPAQAPVSIQRDYDRHERRDPGSRSRRT